jgi:hypothetical protein
MRALFALIRANRNLCATPIVSGVDGRANHRDVIQDVQSFSVQPIGI